MSKIEVKEERYVSDEEYDDQDLDLLLQEEVTEFWENIPSPLKTEPGTRSGKRKSSDDDSEPENKKVKRGIQNKDRDNQGRRTPRRHNQKSKPMSQHDRERLIQRRQNETEEERTRRLDKDKERIRLRRERERLQRNKVKLSEEEKKQKIRERQKQRLKNETEEQRQRRLDKMKENRRLHQERKRLIQNETEEERRRRLDKAKERARRRRETESEEQRRIRLEKGKEAARLRRERERGEENEEEREKRLNKMKETARLRREKERREQNEEEREERLYKMRENARVRRKHETEEERQRRLERLKEAVKRRRQHQTEEDKQRAKIQRYFYSANLTKEQRKDYAMKSRLRWYSLPQEEREETTKRYVETFRKRRHNFTKEEKERYMASVYRALKKYTEKRKQDPEKREKWNAYIRDRHNKAIANETPEKRQKRLWKYKVNAAKTKLKQQLFSEGLPPEEIEKRVKELHDQMWSQPIPIPSSEYKPRARKKTLSTSCESQQITPNDSENSNSIGFPATQVTQVMPVTSHVPSSLEPQLGIRKLQMWSQPPPTTPSTYKLRSRKTFTATCGESKQKRQNETFNSIGFPVISEPPASYASSSHDSQFAIHKFDIEKENGGHQHELDIDADFEDHYAENTTFSPISQDNQDSKPFTSTSNDSSCDGNNLHDHDRSPSPHFDRDTFATGSTLEDEPSHLDHSIKCPHCSDMFSNDSELRLHVKSQHFNLCWKCPKCKDVMLNPSEMSEHFRTKHFSTEDIAKPSQVEVGNNSTTIKNKPTRTFNCVKCPMQNSSSSSFVQNRFSSFKDLSCHVQENHPEAYWPCSHCSILKYSEKSLKIHLKVCRKK